ncbi:hypothetical protein STENM327S_08129 [Streptomyces tendae]
MCTLSCSTEPCTTAPGSTASPGESTERVTWPRIGHSALMIDSLAMPPALKRAGESWAEWV